MRAMRQRTARSDINDDVVGQRDNGPVFLMTPERNVPVVDTLPASLSVNNVLQVE